MGEVLPVAALRQRGGECLQLGRVDPAVPPGDLLRATDLEPLALLERMNELAGFEKALGRAGVEPGIAAAERFDGQNAALEVRGVEVSDLEFATLTRAEASGNVDDRLIVKIEAGDGEATAGLRRLLDDRARFRPTPGITAPTR